MKTPIVIIAIMLCFNVLSQAQTTPNRGQELKEQAQNSLSQKDYIKARYLFKKAYEVFAAREDYPQAIECGIKANGFYIRENFYKEGFELCRSMDQLVWAGEQKTKNNAVRPAFSNHQRASANVYCTEKSCTSQTPTRQVGRNSQAC